jgi:predicted glycosyltransferase
VKFLLYCQHLSGSGHFVRTYEVARALAEGHEVYLVDGGWPVPRQPAPVLHLEIPRIRREGDRLVPLDPGRTMEEVMRQRSIRLQEAVERIEPDVLLVEHFPFSKGSLRGEIMALIRRTSARTCCSLRDIAPVTRKDPVTRDETLEVLRQHFDALLVHGDPGLTRLEDQISWAAEIPVPVVYTGIVSERPAERAAAGGRIVVSAGGTGGEALFRATEAAWRLLNDSRRTLVFYHPPAWRGFESKEGNVRVRPYSAGFLDQLAGADLSISQAGYGTCANLLQTRVPAIVVPHPAMADQAERARLLAERGLVRAIGKDELDAERLAESMREALGRRMPSHELDLDGAQRSREILTSNEWPPVPA